MSIPCDKTFPWVQLFFTLWHWSLNHFLKTLNLLITFEQWVIELWYFIWISLVGEKKNNTRSGGILFLSILSFCPPIWNFNIANNFWPMSARTLIFHMSIPCDKTFPWVPINMLYPVTFIFDIVTRLGVGVWLLLNNES